MVVCGFTKDFGEEEEEEETNVLVWGVGGVVLGSGLVLCGLPVAAAPLPETNPFVTEGGRGGWSLFCGRSEHLLRRGTARSPSRSASRSSTSTGGRGSSPGVGAAWTGRGFRHERGERGHSQPFFERRCQCH